MSDIGIGTTNETLPRGNARITTMTSSGDDQLPPGEARQMQILTPGATLQDATEWSAWGMGTASP